MRDIIREISSVLEAELGSHFGNMDWSPPPNRKMGHLAVPCFRWAKALGQPPPAMAAKLAEVLKSKLATKSWLSRIEIQGPYVNFYMSGKGLFELYGTKARAQNNVLGSSQRGAGKTTVFDYSSTNVAKEIGLHHLRSTALGHSLANIFAFHGFKTVRINYLGDWGTSFGKLILALKTFGDESELKKQGLHYMLDLYVRFNTAEKEKPSLSDDAKAAFRELESGNAEYRRIWKLFREISIAEFKDLYKRLEIPFDHFDGESLYEPKLAAVLADVESKIGTRISDGARVVDLPGHDLPALLQKDDGASLYLTRDIAAAFDRWERFQFDHSLYVVAVQQKLHFKQLFSILKLMKSPFADRCEHISFGMLSFGSKTMKSREGNAIFLRDALDEGKERALELIRQKNPNLPNAEETADAVGMGALLFFDLSQNRNHDIRFSWEQALTFEGDTGPFVQYTHARTSSLNEKVTAHLRTLPPATDSNSRNPSSRSLEILEDEAVVNLLLDWAYFEIQADKALDQRDPSQIAVGALNVAKAFNQLYHRHRFLDEQDPQTVEILLALSNGTRNLLKVSLGLLGIKAPEQM
jgi:arginyl-tRNA synthetase